MPDETLRFGAADLADASVLALIDLHMDGMRRSSPPESVHALDRSGLTAADVDLRVAHQAGHAVAMGALRALPDGTVELKSMRVRPDRLGQGLGRAMLEHLIHRALARGHPRISLETGSGEAFEPALALYRARGFRDGPAFGGYEATPFNQFLHLDLPPQETPA
ncbi:MAG TPA: GNAT family N-acetyltransferase [Brevundimonas sp.]|jgi:putative acetyltransferase|uniref:GNAT family N-acetyltransferase n=1 Tax=Brevundimonas sp. TaxID=1871086 RepID=UPI002DE773F1|nr:GNAT family N-acetyltransferase [Brevundimonas sp.]